LKRDHRRTLENSIFRNLPPIRWILGLELVVLFCSGIV
jgi:hypothetical protein